ncbi:MAG: hypothetical protein LR011_03960, partial [Verrucomicrobia bacterium]|nr:hypothetical protein [Verrucomicrobiota bacterium]
ERAQPWEHQPTSSPPQRGGRGSRRFMGLVPCGDFVRPVGAAESQVDDDGPFFHIIREKFPRVC